MKLCGFSGVHHLLFAGFSLIVAIGVVNSLPGYAKSLRDYKANSVKCASDDECRLIKPGLVCQASQCKRDCPGSCETAILCKSDKNCWSLGPRYACSGDGLCSRRPEEELQEGSKCTVEAHCFPESTSLHCDKQTGRCLCNKPKVWINLEKTCSEPTASEDLIQHEFRRFRRSADSDVEVNKFEKWEPLIAIGIFVFMLGVIAFILKCWISRSSDADKMETKAAKSFKAKLAVLREAAAPPAAMRARPNEVLATVRAGPTLSSSTSTTMPDKQPAGKVKSVLLSLRLPPFNKLKEEGFEEADEDKQTSSQSEPPPQKQQE